MVAISTFDPFDLPDWLGTEQVTWRTDGPLSEEPRVPGWLCAERDRSQPLDLLAVDAAYPDPVCPPAQRHDAHQAWHFGQVLLFEQDGRVVAGVPGVRFDANLATEAIRRVAKAIGASTANFSVSLTL